MAADVEHFLSTHGLKSSILIGHSMGAKTAMAVALRSPSLVDRLIVVDNAPVEAGLTSSFPKYVQAMRRIEDAGITSQKQADEILKEYEPNLGIRQFLLTNLKKVEKEGEGKMTYGWRIPVKWLGSALDQMGAFPYHPDRERYEKPTLFVRGTQSHYVPDETLPIIGRFFPRFEMKDIECGHWGKFSSGECKGMRVMGVG